MHTLAEQAQAFAQFQDYLIRGVIDLFRHHGLSVEHNLEQAGVDVRGQAVVAVVGYAAQTVRGALVLFAPPEVVAEIGARDGGGAAACAALRDVLAEFCSTAAGRVTSRLAGHDVAPLVSTPATICGSDLRLPAPAAGMSAWHRFSAPSGELFARLDAAFEPGFRLAPADGAAEAAVLGGAMVIFAE